MPDWISDWIDRLSAGQLALFFCAFFVGITWLGILLVHPLMRRVLHRNEPSNELIIHIAGTFGLVYAVLLGLRRGQRPTPLDEPAAYPTRAAHDLLRPPTCERMYDETRLVPQYLRRAEFPATKHDLVRLAREHIDEGQALRRLECIPDRRYSSLHDLITEIRVDRDQANLMT